MPAMPGVSSSKSSLNHEIVRSLFDFRLIHLVWRGYADKDNPGSDTTSTPSDHRDLWLTFLARRQLGRRFHGDLAG